MKSRKTIVGGCWMELLLVALVVLVTLLSSSKVVCDALAFQQQQHKRRRQVHTQEGKDNDTSIQIPLNLAIEKEVRRRQEPPIATLTWFRGSVKMAIPMLEERLGGIFKANPWLQTGKIVNDGLPLFGDATLVYWEDYHPSATQNDERIVQRGDPLDRNTPISELYSKTVQYTQLEGGSSSSPFLKVVLLPSEEGASENMEPWFAMVLSISHEIADSHVYYCIYNMLTTTKKEFTSLELKPPCPKTKPALADNIKGQQQQQQQETYSDELAKTYMIGDAAWTFQHSVWMDIKGAFGLLEKLLFSRPGRELWLEVDTKEIQKQKQQYMAAAAALGKDDESVDFVSTNDILSSWFFSQVLCRIGLILVNFRDRLPDHGPHLGRNYWGSRVFSSSDQYSSPIRVRKTLLQKPARPDSDHDDDGTLPSVGIRTISSTNPAIAVPSTTAGKHNFPDPLRFLVQPIAICSSWTMFVGRKTAKNSFTLLGNTNSNDKNGNLLFPLESHVPLFDFVTYCPANFCVMRTWTMGPGSGRTGVYLAGDARLVDSCSRNLPLFLKVFDMTGRD